MLKKRSEVSPRVALSEKNLSLMGVPKEFFSAEVSDYEGDSDVQKVVSRYVDHIHVMFDDCINLTFYGSNGNGKTFLTSIILKNAYRNYYSAQRVTVANYLSTKWKRDKTDSDIALVDRVRSVDFLVLDELGKEPITSKGNELIELDELLKCREEKSLPTIICTNLNLEDVERKYGATMYSMITKSVCLEMVGEDMRQEIFGKRKGVSILLGEDE